MKKGPERKSGPLKKNYEVKCKSVIRSCIEFPAEPGILMQTDQLYKAIQAF
jgi:hypothetical protein